MAKDLHRLELVHRGDAHVHVWYPTCVCGWVGVYRRRRQEAEQQYRDHRKATSPKTTARVKRRLPPRQPTPKDQLPPPLRWLTRYIRQD